MVVSACVTVFHWRGCLRGYLNDRNVKDGYFYRMDERDVQFGLQRLLSHWMRYHDLALPQHLQDRFLTNEYAIKIVKGCNSRRWDWDNEKYMGEPQEERSAYSVIEKNIKLADAHAVLEQYERSDDEVEELLERERRVKEYRGEVPWYIKKGPSGECIYCRQIYDCSCS